MKNKIITLILVVISLSVSAQLKLPSIISDNMVLQQKKEIILWGWDTPEQQIEVITSWGQLATSLTDGNGKWVIKIKTPKATSLSQQIIFKGSIEKKIINVLIGEVWLCSGQSNMEWSVNRTDEFEAVKEKANQPSIRYFKMAASFSNTPNSNISGRWLIVSPENIGSMSAIASHFGFELHKLLQQPVGLVVNAISGSSIESWIPIEVMEKDISLKPLVEAYSKMYDENKEAIDPYEENYTVYVKELMIAREKGTTQPEKPKVLQPRDRHRPAACYNGMINPIINYSFKGVLWYQGENNVGRGKQYKTMVSMMIQTWRKATNTPELSFYMALLAPFIRNSQPMQTGTSEIRMATLETAQSLPVTEVVSTMDVGDLNDIHPRCKQKVGERFALLAAEDTYHLKGVHGYCPEFKKMKGKGNKIILFFDNVNEFKATTPEINGFQLAGQDNKYHLASAKISSNKKQIVVWSDAIDKPWNVRFAMYDGAEVFIYNENMLPLLPFKTDNFKWVSENAIYPGYLNEYLKGKKN